ncbi:ABC transporter ATP-binding protein [Rhodococcus sp. NPDC060090]|uniref:ABC transporter ATP-binding protein n=1 Tax=unclassified Rhodococcus (in: high G+C Gram-positive bacteria) TaxID=192944 RepID=UPI001FF64642|nr:ABC transporter ATP-binding protein [Rhodococcus sp. F64268]MCK0092615.1 ABC transporter ATP-binding protein [Rhodococcus sp. F64268]
MPSQLEVENVTVAFGGRRALDGVDLRAEPGHVTGLIGPNGAGKSTLFDVISGLRKPVNGSVALGGREITKLGPARRARLGMSRTFQRLELFGRLSVRDNLLVAAEMGPDRKQASTVVDGLLDRLDLRTIADTTADALSTGMGRLVEVGRALAARPSVLLLDEPAAGQDHEETERFSTLLRTVADDGVAVLLVEHDMDLVMKVCDTVHVLDLGKIISVGTPDEIRSDERVITAYLGAS